MCVGGWMGGWVDEWGGGGMGEVPPIPVICKSHEL